MNYNKINIINSFFYVIVYTIISIFFSYIFSNSINMFTLYTGIYLFCMGIPSIINFNQDKYLDYISLITIFINILMLLFLLSLKLDFLNPKLFGFLLIICSGFASGFEIPFFIKTKYKFSIIITDYIGSFLGILFFPIILYPFLGFINTIQVVFILFNLFYYKININNKIKYIFLFLNSLYIFFHFSS
jgi:predicted membrane-bound spermidine synthase